MSKTAAISMRVSPEVKQQAEDIFSALGISLSEACNMFLHKVIMVGGIPFEVRQERFNEQTEAAMEEARSLEANSGSVERFDSSEEFFRYLEEE